MIGKLTAYDSTASIEPRRGNSLTPPAGAANVVLINTMTSSKAITLDASIFFMFPPTLVSPDIIFVETKSVSYV
jgi:hypothetical protein